MSLLARIAVAALRSVIAEIESDKQGETPRPIVVAPTPRIEAETDNADPAPDVVDEDGVALWTKIITGGGADVYRAHRESADAALDGLPPGHPYRALIERTRSELCALAREEAMRNRLAQPRAEAGLKAGDPDRGGSLVV